MTRMDVYTIALDRQVIANREWQNGRLRYIKIGRRIYKDDSTTEINMLEEKDTDQWIMGGQVKVQNKIDVRLMGEN